MKIDKNAKIERARQLFLESYNCSQAVAGAFFEELSLSELQTMALAAGFGGGVGGRRELCGAVSGAIFVLGALKGDYDPTDLTEKNALFKQVRSVAENLEERYGTVQCKELLLKNDIRAKENPNISEDYKKRPCLCYVEDCTAKLCDILMESTQ